MSEEEGFFIFPDNKMEREAPSIGNAHLLKFGQKGTEEGSAL